ncbi:hypothetical protein DQ384_08265 [Sphaerisporangium album]|uniref:WD40 repeat domain-containing protein n=1 Tax=Sphaerisporangium album TaxID=509200 RepID=A0A367FMR6_9ACTN|nr:hypothetical protein [Sphaerisporangium album]RCG31561.1 hypothetical protein DQ384_08265 [Sphaerisporangium album]
MKHMRTIALLAVAVCVTAAGVTGPAEATTGAVSASGKIAAGTGAATAAAATVRYAWLAGCPKPKEDYEVPCGDWKLTLRSGKTVKVGEATVFPRGAGGKADKETNAPFAVSGDGTRLLYFRKSDRKLVWKNVAGGASHSLPGRAARVPKGLGMGDVDPTFSPGGDVVVLDYSDSDGKMATLIVRLTDGHIARLPGYLAVEGFSPDGRRILASRFTEENTTEYAVYDTDGAEAESRVVPQVVSNNAPVALADDGVTVGVVIAQSGKPRLRQYDLSTDSVSPAIEIPLTSQDSPYRISWDNSGKLTLWYLTSKKDGTVTRASASTVDPSTGALKKIDSFKVPVKTWNWWLPGD